MGLRFRKRIGFGPFKLNLSRSGVSMSAGVRGASVTVPLIGRRRKPTVTVGAPGTGFYYQHSIGAAAAPKRRSAEPASPADSEEQVRNRLIKAAFDKAAEGQSAETREIIACVLVSSVKHHEEGDAAVAAAIMQAFPDLTEPRLSEILTLVGDALRDVKEAERQAVQAAWSNVVADRIAAEQVARPDHVQSAIWTTAIVLALFALAVILGG